VEINMKISFWDILSVLLLLATVGVVMFVVQIFIDPSGSMNPFPVPTMPSVLVLPTRTSTPLRLPATWTPAVKTANIQQSPSPVEVKATMTLAPSATGFVVPTWTPSITPTFTATITRTPSLTPTPTITVKPFAVTSVQMSVDTSVLSVACPPGHIFTFMAGIVTNNSGTVKYHWEFSDGRQGPVTELNYSSGGTQSVVTTWALGTTGKPGTDPTFNGWAKIYIDEPNHQSFNQQGFALSCTP
jgi:hypothetical protein